MILATLIDGPKIYATVFYLVIILGFYIYIKHNNVVWKPWLGKPHREGFLRIIVSAIILIITVLLIIAIRTAIWKEGITEVFKFDIFVFIGTCLLASITEELVCRGIIFDILKEKHSNAFTVIVSSVIFYVIHGNPVNVGALVFGLLAG